MEVNFRSFEVVRLGFQRKLKLRVLNLVVCHQGRFWPVVADAEAIIDDALLEESALSRLGPLYLDEIAVGFDSANHEGAIILQSLAAHLRVVEADAAEGFDGVYVELNQSTWWVSKKSICQVCRACVNQGLAAVTFISRAIGQFKFFGEWEVHKGQKFIFLLSARQLEKGKLVHSALETLRCPMDADKAGQKDSECEGRL